MTLLFRNNIEPNCSYCLYSTDLGRNELICKNRGIMAAGGWCNSFRYEPTKREPEFAHSYKPRELSENDFVL